MQMANFSSFFPTRFNAGRSNISTLICFLLLLFVFSLLQNCPDAHAMRKHQVYYEGETISRGVVHSYPAAEERSGEESGSYLKLNEERPRHRMGSGIRTHELYRSEETARPGYETNVASPPREREQITERKHGEEAANTREHRVSPGTVRKPEAVTGEQKIAPVEKKKHEAGIETVEKRGAEKHEVEISPIPGVTFVETFIKVLDHEVNGRFLGWRPNDLIIGKFTDNVNNFQLGLLEAARITAVRLKESLSRLGEADAYDQDLQMAVNLLMNKSTQFWFPSAESSYNEALKHLRNYLERLKAGKAHFYYRVDTLIALVSSYRDFLGNCTNTLVKDHEKDGSPVSWFDADDYFYYSQGAAYFIYEILKVVQAGFHEQLVTIDAVDIMEEAIHELHRGVSMSPWIILDRPLDSVFANHRANLGAVLGEAAHLLSGMTQL